MTLADAQNAIATDWNTGGLGGARRAQRSVAVN
jgi:hypothetical protein